VEGIFEEIKRRIQKNKKYKKHKRRIQKNQIIKINKRIIFCF
jgi:hypothetical protein